MSAITPSATSCCVSAVSPGQWLRAFAYTPDSARVVHHSGHRDSKHVVQHHAPLSDADLDALPTEFRSSGAVSGSGVLLPGVRRDVSIPSLTVPTKRRRPSSAGEAPSLSPASASEYSLTARHPSASQPHTKKTRTRTRYTYLKQEPRRGCGRGQDHHPRASASSARPQSRRLVLDAVEIVSKRSARRMADLKTSPTENACKTPSLHYPSPPFSRGFRDVAVHDNRPQAHVPHSNTAARDNCASPELTLPPKTSVYFARPSALQTCFVPEDLPVLTPPSSPIPTIPVYIESSDFEYPPFDGTLDEPVQDAVDESKHVPTWYDNPELYDDLIIMLKRLKPILVQESVRNDPWKVLVAVRLLNVTTGKAAIPVFCKIMSRWPTPQDLVDAPLDELVELLRPLGLYNKRARWLKDVSMRFLEDRQAPSCSRPSSSLLPDERTVPAAPRLGYPGVGPYALDSLRIFCVGGKDAWKHVMPRDKELVRYLRWRWAVEDGKIWFPNGRGVIGDVTVPYLITLVDELAAHYDDSIGGEGYMYHFCNDLCGVLGGNMAGQSTS